MKTASEIRISQINASLKGNPKTSVEDSVAVHLRAVANAFIQAQQQRNDADYNIAKEWTQVEVNTHLAVVRGAFESWRIIRNEAIAQAYLVSLLGTRERRPTELKAPNAQGERSRPRPDSFV